MPCRCITRSVRLRLTVWRRHAARRGGAAPHTDPGGQHEPAGYRPAARDWRFCGRFLAVIAMRNSPTARRSAQRTRPAPARHPAHLRSGGPSSRRFREDRHSFFKMSRCIRSRSFSQRSRELSAVGSGTECPADTDIGGSAAAAFRPPLRLRQVRSIEGEIPARWRSGSTADRCSPAGIPPPS
jgi:hypothetical protein